MDDMSGILARDFGIRPQGKAAPMAASKTAPGNRSTSSTSAWTSGASPSYDDFFNPTAPSAPSAAAKSRSTGSQPHDPILDTFSKGPVFDTPVYDDDIFDGVPGVRSSGNMRFDDVFGSGTSDRSRVESPPAYDDLLGSLGSSSGRVDRSHAASPPPYDDFLGGLGAAERKDAKDKGSVKTKSAADLSGFDDLLPGFGSAVPPQPKRETHEADLPKPQNPAPSVQDDPFSVFETVTSTRSVPPSGLFSDPLDEFTTAGPTVVDSSTAADNLFSENHNSFESGSSNNGREKSADLNGSFREKNNPKLSARDTSPMGSFHKKGLNESSPLDDFDMPSGRTGHRSMGSDSFSRNKMLGKDPSPESSENSETGEDVWLTVSEIPLFTRPTSAPPPSRPPPPLTVKHKSRQNHSFNKDSSPVDDLEDFAMGNTYPQKFEFDEGEMERSSAAMKDAMNRAEAKFRHAKEVREKMKGKEAEHQDTEDAEREIAEKEREQREKEDRERERRRIEREEEEKRRKERDMARMAVERATREARERAANEARLRAERAAVLRAQQEARERAAAEARERVMSEAKEKAEREAREKAAAEAAAERERVQREAREKAAAERLEKERAEKEMQRRNRAAVERAAAEARERAARAAKEKYQQQSQAPQRKPDPVPQSRSEPDDLESFFGSRANSAPRPERSPASADPLFETQTQTRGPSDTSRRTASSSGPSIPKAASVNMMDDLSAIFGAPSSSSGGEFQEIDGEPPERRNARWKREQAAKDRATKALQEKNERDMQVQREQAERHRIGESLDFEIRRWSAGKEGNLRALLSSLHYILWQESGWQPVSMADLINGQNVKKVYRKATLCVHPDKVQQKGATLQQKYIAEKVFDLLKEAWNKFNSEELF